MVEIAKENELGQKLEQPNKPINQQGKVKDSFLLRYYHKVINTLQKFDASKVKHIPREDNTLANMLSKLTTSKASQY
ncbi:hypothetical protein CR513_07106, partial [Mucuna pruriens]